MKKVRRFLVFIYIVSVRVDAKGNREEVFNLYNPLGWPLLLGVAGFVAVAAGCREGWLMVSHVVKEALRG